jgi:hypothetical protein
MDVIGLGNEPSYNAEDIALLAQQEAAYTEKLNPLLAELGGDSPQARAIAEGLQRQGIASTKDIGTREVMRTSDITLRQDTDEQGNRFFSPYSGWGFVSNQRYSLDDPRIQKKTFVDEGGGESTYYVIQNTSPEVDDDGNIVKQFYNKANGQSINPNRLGIIQNGQAGVEGGDVFFNLRSDENGNVKFDPQWSPRSRGFLGSGIGQAILTLGSIIPNPLTPAFVAAKAGYALAHDQPLQALAAVLPYGLQEFATASNLADLAGNADFVSTAKTAAGKIAEAAGAPSAYADAFGKAGVAALRSGLTGGDMGKALLMSQLPSAGSFVKDAGDFSKGIAGFDIGDTSEFDASALNDPNALDSVTVRPGWNSWEGDDNEPSWNSWEGGDNQYTLDNNPNYVTPPGQGMVDDAWTTEGIPSVFSTNKLLSGASKIPFKPSSGPKADLSGLLSLLGAASNQPQIDAKFENFQSPTDLKGGYAFDWNAQDFNKPEGGNAYSQDYYGQHWTKPMAEGGVTSLVPFKPTVGDGGINANELSGSDIANQAIQHLRSGGHVMDDKTHSDIKYLASKGEPVHHIVGFMKYRMGGLTSLGSYSDGGQLLKGPGDGMSDDIPATIADKQPARLANEEFVIPADVVSHLGNGSSESGAKVLYDMMAKVRKARTGNPKQGKQIDAHKFMPKV